MTILKRKYATETKLITTIANKTTEIILLAIFGIVASSFFLAALVIVSAELANQ